MATARQRHDAESLTAVALETFRTRGYDATSMEHLAAAAGLSKAAFYHHVDGKEALLARGLDRALDALEAVLNEAPSTEGPALDRLQHIFTRVIQLEHDLLPEVTVLLRTRGNSETERAALARRRNFDRRVGSVIAQAQVEGSVRTDLDAHLLARLTIGMATSLIEWYKPGGKLGATQLAHQTVSVMCIGITQQED